MRISHGSCNGASFDGLASCPGVNIQKYVENPWGTRKGTSLRNMIHIYGGENRIFLHVYRVFTTIVGRFHFFYLFGIARIYFNHILYIHIECGVCFDVVLSVLSHQRKGWGSARLCHRRNPAEGSIVLESCWMPR